MQQPQAKIAQLPSPRKNAISNHRTIERLKGEISQNQRRIERLHQRNTQIAQQLAQMESPSSRTLRGKRPQPSVDTATGAVTGSKQRSLRLKKHHSQPSISWLSLSIFTCGIVMICATIGFVIARSIAGSTQSPEPVGAMPITAKY